MFLIDRLIILGNHRDAWVYGAADPSSGTATMIEVAKAFGWLRKKGDTLMLDFCKSTGFACLMFVRA